MATSEEEKWTLSDIIPIFWSMVWRHMLMCVFLYVLTVIFLIFIATLEGHDRNVDTWLQASWWPIGLYATFWSLKGAFNANGIKKPIEDENN